MSGPCLNTHKTVRKLAGLGGPIASAGSLCKIMQPFHGKHVLATVFSEATVYFAWDFSCAFVAQETVEGIGLATIGVSKGIPSSIHIAVPEKRNSLLSRTVCCPGQDDWARLRLLGGGHRSCRKRRRIPRFASLAAGNAPEFTGNSQGTRKR